MQAILSLAGIAQWCACFRQQIPMRTHTHTLTYTHTLCQGSGCSRASESTKPGGTSMAGAMLLVQQVQQLPKGGSVARHTMLR